MEARARRAILSNVIADTPARRGPSRQSEHVFYVGMSIASIAIAFAGFAKTYFLRPYFHPEQLSLTVHLHGAAFTAWVLLLLVQTTLVSAGRVDIHRKLGWLGTGLAAFMVVIAMRAALIAVHAAVVCCDAGLARGFLLIPIADVIVFGVLVGCAVAYRREPSTHKRLMLLATFTILDAATTRWPFHFIQTWKYAYYVAIDAIILAAAAYDTMARRHLARAYTWGVPLVIGSHVLREVIGKTAVWRAFASILVG
jgi:hypothetical protein